MTKPRGVSDTTLLGRPTIPGRAPIIAAEEADYASTRRAPIIARTQPVETLSLFPQGFYFFCGGKAVGF